MFTNRGNVSYLLIALYALTYNLLVEINCVYVLVYIFAFLSWGLNRNQEDRSVLGTSDHMFLQSEHRTMKVARLVHYVPKS